MVVTFRYIDPFIASRHGRDINESIVFEGSKKECENYLLNEFNDCFSSETFQDSVKNAVRWSNKRNCFDGLFRTLKQKRLYMNWDSRQWEIKFKKELIK